MGNFRRFGCYSYASLYGYRSTRPQLYLPKYSNNRAAVRTVALKTHSAVPPCRNHKWGLSSGPTVQVYLVTSVPKTGTPRAHAENERREHFAGRKTNVSVSVRLTPSAIWSCFLQVSSGYFQRIESPALSTLTSQR